MGKKIIFILIAFINGLPSIANSFNEFDNDIIFEKLTIHNGLSHNNVYTIIQDQSGYMWFGTQDGLNRYDGSKFTVFRNDPNNKNTITTSNFGKIYQDRAGYYWFGTFGGGIDLLDPRTNTLKNFSYNPNDSTTISNNQALFIFEDSNSNIWIGTPDGGLNLFNRTNDSFTRYQHNPANPKSLSHKRAKSMCETPDGTLWVGTQNGLNKFNPKDGTFERYFHDPNNKNSLSGNIIQNMVPDKDGSIWIVIRGGGLNKFNPQSKQFTHYLHNPKDPYSISDNKADCILMDSYGKLWVGTYEGGLNKFDPETGLFTCFVHVPNNNESISSNRIEFLFEDNAQILWIGTRGGGINKLDLKPPKFNNLTHIANSVNSIPQHSVMAITSDNNGNVWIGTDGGGITRYNPKTKQYRHFLNQPNNPNSLSSNRVWALQFDNNGVLWAGTYNGGLNRLEIIDDKFTFTRYLHHNKTSSSLSSNQINALLQDDANNIWIATSSGLNLLVKSEHPTSYTFKSFYHNTADSLTFVDNYINSIIQDSKGRIIIGSYRDGVLEFNPATEEFKQFIPKNVDPLKFLKDIRLLALFQDSQSNLWLGTESSGMLKFDLDQGDLTPHPYNNSLSANMVISITEDSNKKLWIASTGGLYKYSLEDSTLKSYTISDGLQNNGFNRNAVHKSKDGRLWFGSISALTNFYPSDVLNNPHIPNVTITDIKVLNQSIWNNQFEPFKHLMHESGEIILSYKDYFFSIYFASLDYTNPNNNYYKYKLEGFDSDWVEITNNNSATFTNLNPGKYVFKVMGSNNDKVWNETPTELNIRIIPPFWKRIWFYLLEILTVILLILAYIRLRTRNLKKDKKVLEAKVSERTKEINSQKDEIEATLLKLKETQSQLIQSEKMASVGVLTAGIAHEINNPINFVYAGVNSIMRDFFDIDKVLSELNNLKNSELPPNELVNRIIEKMDEYDFYDSYSAVIQTLNDIRIGAQRTTEIVEGLRNFSRSENFSWGKVDIHKLIEGVLLLLKNLYKNRIVIEKNYCSTLPEILCMPGKLNQVFMNLIANAIDSIENEGLLTITTLSNYGNAVIIIEDTGSGISEDVQHKIFDPFFTTKEIGKGVGLGLSITYAIIEEHNGTINLTTEVGKGTKFEVVLPLIPKEEVNQ